MGLFSRLTKPKHVSPEDTAATLKKELAALNKDGRLHARIRLHDPTLGQLILPDGSVGVIADISYGGLAAIFPTEALQINPATPMMASITLMGQTVAARITLVRLAPGGAAGTSLGGFCVHHETPASLLFLREFIEPSRSGESIGALAQENRQTRYQDPSWHCFRGDGPADLILRTQPGQLFPDEALLTFRMNEAYWELIYKNGQLKTGRAMEGSSSATDPSSSRMGTTAGIDGKILRAAVFIMASSPNPCRQLTLPIVNQAKKALLLLAGTPV